MISVKRPDAPKELTEPDSIGLTEYERVTKFYAIAANKEEPFRYYRAYKEKIVGQMLEALFHGKCAYCESRYSTTHPVDIEHFRPKGEVIINGQPEKPGYYWLAANWENLLPSCIDCNRERYHIQADGTRLKTGKKNRFPIDDENKRAKVPGDEKNENALLLNPCAENENPAEHLEFTAEGDVRPRKKGESANKAIESINVYGLQRNNLRLARKERAILICAQIERVKELNYDLNEEPDNRRIIERLEREMKVLKNYIKPEQIYVGMAQQLIEQYFKNL